MIRITDDERRRRIGVRHRLAPGSAAVSLSDAAASMVTLHATDPVGVHLQARARLRRSSPESLSDGMYRTRTVLRQLAMRRTLFLAAVEDVPMVHAAATRAVAEVELRRTLALLADTDVDRDTRRLLDELTTIGLRAVRDRGPCRPANCAPWIRAWTDGS